MLEHRLIAKIINYTRGSFSVGLVIVKGTLTALGYQEMLEHSLIVRQSNKYRIVIGVGLVIVNGTLAAL